MSPTSLPRVASRLARNANFWIDVGVNLFSPAYSVYNTGRFVLNEVKDLHNPVAADIPVALPNKASGLFAEIRQYRFQDGGRFDFRGDKKRSINGRAARLANSNEKALFIGVGESSGPPVDGAFFVSAKVETPAVLESILTDLSKEP